MEGGKCTTGTILKERTDFREGLRVDGERKEEGATKGENVKVR